MKSNKQCKYKATVMSLSSTSLHWCELVGPCCRVFTSNQGTHKGNTAGSKVLSTVAKTTVFTAVLCLFGKIVAGTQAHFGVKLLVSAETQTETCCASIGTQTEPPSCDVCSTQGDWQRPLPASFQPAHRSTPLPPDPEDMELDEVMAHDDDPSYQQSFDESFME